MHEVDMTKCLFFSMEEGGQRIQTKSDQSRSHIGFYASC